MPLIRVQILKDYQRFRSVYRVMRILVQEENVTWKDVVDKIMCHRYAAILHIYSSVYLVSLSLAQYIL
jgi:hypothetical protein